MNALGVLADVVLVAGLLFICYSVLINTSFLALTVLAVGDLRSYRALLTDPWVLTGRGALVGARRG